jgi:hypothetical protein
MLARQTLSQNLVAVAFRDQIFIRRPLAGENGAADVNERENERCLEPLVFSLNMIDNALMLDVGVESGNHWSRSYSPNVLRLKYKFNRQVRSTHFARGF